MTKRFAKRLRLFAALYPPREQAVLLSQLLDGLELPEHRATPLDKIHLTAHFIGDVDSRQVDRTAESVQRAAAGVKPLQVRVEQLIALPQGHSARLIAGRISGPGDLLELNKRLVSRLSNSRKRSNFLPHFTLCRFRRPCQFEVSERCSPLPPGLAQAFPLHEVHLVHSHLTPHGSEYRSLARFALGE